MVENDQLTYSNVKKWFEYNPETGEIKHTMEWPGLRKGKDVAPETYINGERYYRTMFAYILMTEKVPRKSPRLRDTGLGFIWSNIYVPNQKIDTGEKSIVSSFLSRGFAV